MKSSVISKILPETSCKRTTEDVLLCQKRIPKLTFPVKEPFRHWTVLAPCAHSHPPRVTSMPGPEHRSSLRTFSVPCPGSFLLSFPVPFPASLHPPLQPVSLSLSPSPPVFNPRQEWGQTPTLSKAMQSSSPPHSIHWIKRKEAGTLNCNRNYPAWQPGWKLVYWAKQVRRRGGIRTECRGGCGISVLRFLREESESTVRCNSAPDCEAGAWVQVSAQSLAALGLWLLWLHYKDPVPTLWPSGNTCFSIVLVQESSFPCSLCRCDTGRDKTVHIPHWG